jgi:hypothetical protein
MKIITDRMDTLDPKAIKDRIDSNILPYVDFEPEEFYLSRCTICRRKNCTSCHCGKCKGDDWNKYIKVISKKAE